MNLKGQRQSKNVEDIQKQKKRILTAPIGALTRDQFPPSVKTTTQPMQEPRKKNPRAATINSPALRQKSGMNSMDDAARRDSQANSERTIDQNNLDDLLNKAFSDKNKGTAGGQKPVEASAPTQLNEIWTPRPLK